MPSILFMCTGNVHRSPIAAAIFKKKIVVSKYASSDFSISSAGTWTRDGMRVGSRTTAFAQHHQLDIRGHRSRAVNEQILKDVDLVIVMEQGQLEALSFEFPQYKSRIHILTAVGGSPAYDIPDPVRVGREEHAQILGEIMEIIDGKFEAICQLALDLAKV